MLRTYFAALLLGAVATLLVSSLPAAPAPTTSEPLSPLNECKENRNRCVLGPEGCDLTIGNCTLVLAAHKEGDDFIFNMWTSYSAYVSVAFGESSQMGNDSVIECVKNKDGESVTAYMSFNSGNNKKQRGNKRLPTEEQKGIKLLKFNTADGGVSCSVQRDQKTSVQKKEYDLATGSWNLQVAAGKNLKEDGGIAHHARWVVSPKVMITKDGLKSVPTDGPNSATTSSVSVVLLLVLMGVTGVMHR